MASASSGGCARRSNFISAIAGFAVSNSKTRFLIIRPSRSIATAASATATSYAMCLRLWCGPGLVKGEGLAVDASVMEADASRYHGKAPDEIDRSGVAEHHSARARTIRSGNAGGSRRARHLPQRGEWFLRYADQGTRPRESYGH